MKLKLKVWGSEKALKIFLKELNESYLAINSTIRPSSQGDFHAYATIEVSE